ncbi:MAG: metal-dependent transcriptional regulator [Methanomicrobia archaeon]|nr:metal-dependent transcriptional regulator [Methanomicrobia archaeon]
MLSRKTEDYLEAIYNIIEKKGYARVKDIASELKVSSPSVTEMMRKLNERGFIVYEKYSGITLTDNGRKIAEGVKKRHVIFEGFLEIILVPGDVASEDACTMEHHLDPKTIEQFSKFVEFVNNAPVSPKWLTHFKEYCKTGKYKCEFRD